METNSSISEPLLPPELECMIFEEAALAQRTIIPTLMLVAKRVKDWVEPLLYRVIMLWSTGEGAFGFPAFTVPILLKILEKKPQEFFQNFVKHLFLQGRFEFSDLETIFTACNRATNIYDYYVLNSHSIGVLGGLNYLRHLSIPLGTFLDLCTHQTPSLHTITHLQLLSTYDKPGMERVASLLPLLPRLTHIAFNSIAHHHGLQAALQANVDLQCILFLISAGYQEEEIQDTDKIVADSRFVCLDQETSSRSDWLRGADSGEDFWALANEFIAARRQGKVDRAWYTISDTDHSWRV
ncbi:hypothetical protein B0H19DRAFT_1151712 [Mycena capillaripes]|nr:hypothetical protein B0H19DRAFT_1151712 [Mycena capillaripes]